MSRPGIVARLARYPVKGFAGVDLSHVSLDVGRGLPYDRALAVTNSTLPVGGAGTWTDSDAFRRLLMNAELLSFGVELHETADGAVVRLESPTGETLAVRVTQSGADRDDLEAANAVVSSWFEPGPLGPARLESPGVGLWDHEDATVSIISLDTLRALADEAGEPVDPRRFRANVYVSETGPWWELASVGRRLRLGEVELEVTRPIDRCRATTVGPDSSKRDLNIPGVLAAQVGHLYCGVYARVVRAGTVRVGDSIIDLGDAPAAIPAGRASRYAAPIGTWPRPARVVRTVEETGGVLSVWIDDPYRHLATYAPGQHLRLHLHDGTGLTWRGYTISGADDTGWRISVKREPRGRVSGVIHSLQPGAELIVTGPFGAATLSDTAQPLLLVTAGIGITPAVAVLRELARRGDDREVGVLHVAKDVDSLAMWDEVAALVSRLSNGRATLHLTDTDEQTRQAYGAVAGRPTADSIRRFAAGSVDPEVIVCGPQSFLRSVRETLLETGVPPDRIGFEAFFSPRPQSLTPVDPPCPGPFDVEFVSTGQRISWSADFGTILDLADQAGIRLPSACRSGACGTCAHRIVAGQYAYVLDPVTPPVDGEVLLCSAVPTSDLVVDA